MSTRTRWALSLTWIGYFGLFFLLMAWPTLLAAPKQLPVALILLFAPGPLLLVLPGVLNGRRRSIAGAAYLSLFYLIHATVESYANPESRELAIAELIFALLLFSGATYYLKYHRTPNV
ncbi:MAG: DUF2069 domain-containing protein [Methylococcales bacterium]|nr:DUF2069 domain-containing protein [Methylococcales bacterium]